MDAAEGWKFKLVKELNAAGLDFDPCEAFVMNQVAPPITSC
jgi:hypothetical protein